MKSLPELIDSYNDLTNPAKLKTAEQNEADKKEVAIIRNLLNKFYKKGFDYEEKENGKLSLGSFKKTCVEKCAKICGRKFQNKFSKKTFIVAQVGKFEYKLISLTDGNRWVDGLDDIFGGEESKFEMIG